MTSAPPAPPRVVLFGNPNCGKSTLFNALTHGHAQVGNFAGTTVEQLAGDLRLPSQRAARCVDVPGTYSFAARSPDERVALEAVLGVGVPAPQLVLFVADAPRLARSLYLLAQLLELEVPVVVALNLMDEARAAGLAPDPDALARWLRVPVFPVVARTGEGLDALRRGLDAALAASAPPAGPPHPWPDAVEADVDAIVTQLPPRFAAIADGHPQRARALARWVLLSADDPTALADEPGLPRAAIDARRAAAAAAGRDLQTELVGVRWAWIDSHLPGVLRGPPPTRTLDDRLDAVLLHPVLGVITFAVVMALVFTALFSWAEPAIGAVESVFSVLGDGVRAGLERALPVAPWAQVVTDGAVDGAIGGVGAVVVFLPQIALLFGLLALLEDSGYLARAAHLMDRVLRAAGLPGQAFVPLVSGYACAVPAILATRTLPRARDRLLTMLVIPLTSCSARLPVYTLMIAAVFPATTSFAGVDWPTRPFALFAMYALSTGMAVAASVVLGAWVLPADASATLLELPPYRVPHLPTVGRLVWRRCREFLREATGTILVATLVLWALLYFPRVTPEEVLPPEVVAAHADQPDALVALAAGPAVAQSYAGRIGRALEPALTPLGYDWKIGVGLIGAFAAREVFVSTLGVVYGLEDAGEDDPGLRAQLAAERTPAGRPRYTPLVGASLLVFFAFAMQCLSTLAVLRKETRGWTWPAFAVVYLSVLAWTSACLVYQGGRWLGFE